jgi:flavodoxin
MKSIIVLFSYHHHNTEKVAKVFAKILDAQIVNPLHSNPKEPQKYDLVGFGSGIDSDKHYKPLLDYVDKLPKVTKKKAFIFSTSGIPFAEKSYMPKCHALLKKKLISKGYLIVDEFICRGFNTNVFLKYFGGINKGHPDKTDLDNASLFAHKLKSAI